MPRTPCPECHALNSMLWTSYTECHPLNTMLWTPCPGHQAQCNMPWVPWPELCALNTITWIPCLEHHALNTMLWTLCPQHHVLNAVPWTPCPDCIPTNRLYLYMSTLTEVQLCFRIVVNKQVKNKRLVFCCFEIADGGKWHWRWNERSTTTEKNPWHAAGCR